MSKIKTLDPENWEAAAQCFHQAIDHSLDFLRDVRERPVWQPVPDEVKARIQEPLPRDGQALSETLQFFEEAILRCGTGNTHPRFFGWVHGSGNVAGALGEMLAAMMNCNVGGRDHVAVDVERQVLAWCKQIFSFPEAASGILTSGSSMGTLIALTAARNAKAGGDIRMKGVQGLPKRLVGYASREAHACIAKAFDLLGLGQEALRLVPVNDDYQMNVTALAALVRADHEAGLAPFVVAASAGTVNTGAMDDLAAIHTFCRENGLWMHVDAAFGGLAILTPEFQERLAPLAQADSLAFDFHKWLHVPYDAGCVLVRDEQAHRQAFSTRPDYVAHHGRALAGGDPWFCEYGPELSRGFRALKIWFTIKTYGIERLGEVIAQNCRQAQFLAGLITENKHLQLLAPVPLNIVCFQFFDARLSADALDALNADIVAELQLRGIAAPSTTRIHGQLAIRVCLTNHRTRDEDLQILMEAVCEIGSALAAQRGDAGA